MTVYKLKPGHNLLATSHQLSNTTTILLQEIIFHSNQESQSVLISTSTSNLYKHTKTRETI